MVIQMNEMHNTARVGLFGDLSGDNGIPDDFDLRDFATKKRSENNHKGLEKEVATRVAMDNNFTSREPREENKRPLVGVQRRFRTGRSHQLNIKATIETAEKLYRIANTENIALGELLENALTAYENQKVKI